VGSLLVIGRTRNGATHGRSHEEKSFHTHFCIFAMRDLSALKTEK
jgi:hypothetical protein